MQAHGLAHASSDPVAHHRLAERPRRSETDARSFRLRLPHAERRKERARKTGPFIINPAEIRGSQQTNTFWEAFLKGRDAYLSELTVSL
jgi:hypothetical protein